MEVDAIPQQTQEKVAQIDSADLVVGILADLGKDGIVALREGLRALPGSPRIVVLQRDPVGNAPAASLQTVQEDASPYLLPWSAVGPDPLGVPMQSISIACQSLFAASEKMGARACCFVASRDGKRIAAMDLPIIASSRRIGFRLGRPLLRAPHVAGPAQQQHYLSPYPMSVRKENTQSFWTGRWRFAKAGSENSWHVSEC